MSETKNIISGVNDGGNILGEVITWSTGMAGSCGAFTVSRATVKLALENAGFDQDVVASVARDLSPRNAFLRAVHKLGDEGLIRKVDEDANAILFQLTDEQVKQMTSGDKQLAYAFKAILAVDKKSGRILDTKNPGSQLQQKAVQMFDRAKDTMSARDITRLVQKIMGGRYRMKDAKNKTRPRVTLYPVRKTGGMYFVFRDELPFVESIAKFMADVGGTFERLPIAAGAAHGGAAGARIIRELVVAEVERNIAEHMEAVDSFDKDDRPSTLERRAQKIADTRLLLECRQAFLQDMAATLTKKLAFAEASLRAKIAAMTADDEGEGECEGDEVVEQLVTSGGEVIAEKGDDGRGHDTPAARDTRTPAKPRGGPRPSQAVPAPTDGEPVLPPASEELDACPF